MTHASNPLNIKALVHVDLIPLGLEGDYIFVQKEGPGPNCNRVYVVWSRWLQITTEKSRQEFENSDSKFIEKICEYDTQF